jgi:hypothetical protein
MDIFQINLQVVCIGALRRIQTFLKVIYIHASNTPYWLFDFPTNSITLAGVKS